MQVSRHITPLFCGICFVLLFFAGTDAAARVGSPAPASWTPPTPAEGATLRAAPGDPLRFSLTALAQDAPSVTITIAATGVPPGATFRTTPGNPAAAGFDWVPTRAHAGRKYSLTFTAQPDDAAVPPRTRRIDVEVIAREATRFALSSSATATYRWAFVIRRVLARSAPSRTAAPLARLRLLTLRRRPISWSCSRDGEPRAASGCACACRFSRTTQPAGCRGVPLGTGGSCGRTCSSIAAGSP